MLINNQELKKDLDNITAFFVKEIKNLKTGKANSEVLENIEIEAYGGVNKLNTLGQVQVEDFMNVKISIWDKSVVPNVEKALREANLGGSVVMDRDFIRIKYNPITEEDRIATVKTLKEMLEETRIKIRQIRHNYLKKIDTVEKISEDEKDREEKSLQTQIDQAIKSVEEIASKKEQELLNI